MKNKNICVIGGLGFVGRNLTEILDNSNYITIFDIGDRPKSLLNHIEYVDVSRNNLNKLKNCYYDFIFYLVGNSSVGNSVSNPILDLEKNTIHLLNFLEIIKNNHSKLIFASSAACYGEMKNSITANNDEPISPYGITKLYSEKYLKYYHKHYGLQILICRFFSLFGKYNQKQVIYDTTLRLLNYPSKLTIFNPKSRRDFIYVDEAIEAMLFLCNQNKFNAEVFDIGMGKSLSIFELTETIQNFLNIYPLIKTIKTNFTGDPEVQIANINKLKRLGFNFRTSTLYNLRKTVDWIVRITK